MDSPRESKSLKSVHDEVQKSLVSTVKYANRIAAEDLGFQRTVNPEVAQQLDDKSSRLLDLATRLLQSSAKACGVEAPALEDAEDIDMKWRSIVDVVDSLLEKADTAMDEYTGLVKRKEPPTTDSPSQSKKPKSTAKVIRNANVTKPQLKFELKPDNFPSAPWKPLLTSKPHATVPLKDSLVTFSDDKGEPQYKHPYEPEIKQMEYPDRVYQSATPIPYQPVDKTEATWVDTYEGVLEMLEELKKAKEIAVDLEHHDFRTYTGLVSLMQVSTREKDWIVDTLQPWRHKLEVLNEAFADPSIVKVFHGAYMDMVWLQRDLGLYVNGLFDTYFACEQLYSGRSLAFLLSKFVDFDADKQYQLADWRIRPIPEEMLYYARSDTHYLLYIYDCVRNDLVAASGDRSDPETDRIGYALKRSKELSLSRHEHPGYNEETGQGSRGWSNYILKHGHLAFNAEQFSVFRALWKWRDATGRKEDESPNFVMGTHHVAEIARINPPDAKALHSLLPQTAPLARSRFSEIWAELQAAKAQGGPSLLQFLQSQAPDSVGRDGLPRIQKTPVQIPGMVVDVTMARLQQSRLFGSMPISSRWEETPKTKNDQEDLIAFPWQRFVQDVAVVDELANEQPPSAASELPAEPQPEPTKPVDEEFTLRRGTKRKSDAVEEESEGESETSEESSDGEGDSTLPDAPDATDAIVGGVISVDDTVEKRLSKKQRKAQLKEEREQLEREKTAHKEAKAQRKAQKKEKKTQEKGKKYDAVPFDYSQAASVMNPPKDPAAQAAQKTKKAKKVFDPYSKIGDDEIKGARKAPPIRGERSATFKK
jgi:exosome complex exonuclease RRP6